MRPLAVGIITRLHDSFQMRPRKSIRGSVRPSVGPSVHSKNTGSDSFSPIPFWAAALTGMMPLLGIDLMELLSFSPSVMIR